LKNGYERGFKKDLVITFVAITNDIPMDVAIAHDILVVPIKIGICFVLFVVLFVTYIRILALDIVGKS